MANPWFRLYSEFADDPKVQIMPETMQRRLLMLFCHRCKCGDVTVTFRDAEMAFHWRITTQEMAETKALFITQGFIDEEWNVLNWDERQYKSDTSKERTKRWRAKLVTSHKRHGDGVVTVPDSDTDSDTEQKQRSTQIGRASCRERV